MTPTALRILLAEDNQADVLLVRTALEEEGVPFALNTLSDGEEVLKYLDRIDSGSDTPVPDLIILDLNLPRYDGIEILSRLRSEPKCRQAPVIVMTSSDSPRDRQDAAGFGIAAYFHKPSDLEEFMALGKLVRSVIATRALAASAGR